MSNRFLSKLCKLIRLSPIEAVHSGRSMPGRKPQLSANMDENDPRSPFTQIRRELDVFRETLQKGSSQLRGLTEIRPAVDEWLEEISSEYKRLNQEIQEEEHQRRNLVQAGLNALENAKRDSGTIEELGQRMGAWLNAQISARVPKSYDDAGLALMKPLVEHLVNPGKYGAMADRLQLDGGPVVVSAGTIRILKIVLRELSTNAAKHGAFRTDGGNVDIRWHVEGSGDTALLLVDWQERCTSEVKLPEFRGEGYARMTKRMPRLYGYEVEERHGTGGVRYLFRIPHETVAWPDKHKILVVDDEKDIFEMLERRWANSDVTISYADSLKAAIEFFQSRPRQDLVLIDKELRDGDGCQVADYLPIRGVPFLFLTGSPDGNFFDHSRALRISKPLSGPALDALVPSLLTSPEIRSLK